MLAKIAPIIYSGIFTACKIISGFILVKIVAFVSGPAGIVALGQIQSLIGAVNGLVTAPLGNGLIKHTAENIEGGDAACSPWWRASIAWTLILMLMVSTLLIFSSNYLSEYISETLKNKWIVLLIVISIPFSIFSMLIPSVLNGRFEFKKYSLYGITANLLSSILAVYIIYKYKSTYSIIISVVILSGLNGLILAILANRQSWFKIKLWIGCCEKKYINDVAKFILMALTSSICSPLSLILIRNELIDTVGWDLAGYWQAVYKISDVYLSIITITFSTYFLPKLARTEMGLPLYKEIRKMFFLVMPIAIVLGFFIYFLRLDLLEIAFSEEFKKAEALFLIQIIGDVIKIGGWMLAYVVISKGFNRLYIFSEITFSIIFVVLSIIFIRLYGVNGANIAYLINFIFYLVFMTLSIIYINKTK